MLEKLCDTQYHFIEDINLIITHTYICQLIRLNDENIDISIITKHKESTVTNSDEGITLSSTSFLNKNRPFYEKKTDYR